MIAPAASTTTATPIPMYKLVLESDLLLANAVAVALGVADSLVGLGVADSVVGVGVGVFAFRRITIPRDVLCCRSI